MADDTPQLTIEELQLLRGALDAVTIQGAAAGQVHFLQLKLDAMIATERSE